jgi:hypothetical protein
MKKVLKAVLAMILICSSVGLFTACGCAPTTENVDISAETATAKNYLLENVYNKPAGTDFNTTGEDEYIEDDDYYITVKENVTGVLTSIKVGGVEFEEGEDISLSVGNANYLVRDAWKLDDGELKVASGLLLASTSKQGKVEVIYFDKTLNLTILGAPSSTNVDVDVTGTNSTISEPDDDDVYTYTSSNYAGSMNIMIQDAVGENLLAANSVIVTQRIKKNAQGNVIDVKYGFTTADEVGGELALVLFPAYNAGVAFTPGNPANFTEEFRFHVLGVGAGSITYRFVNSASA